MGGTLTQKQRTIKWLKDEGFCNNCKYRGVLVLLSKGSIDVCLQEEKKGSAFNAQRLACDDWQIESGEKINGTMDTFGSEKKAELTLDIEVLKQYQKDGMKISAEIPNQNGDKTFISIELKVQT